jgi:hypothetical protein
MNYLPLLNILEDLKLDYTITRMKEKNNHGMTTLSNDIMIIIVISDDNLLEIMVTDDYWRYPKLTSYFITDLHTNGTTTCHPGTPFLRSVVGVIDDVLMKVSRNDTHISESYIKYPRA